MKFAINSITNKITGGLFILLLLLLLIGGFSYYQLKSISGIVENQIIEKTDIRSLCRNLTIRTKHATSLAEEYLSASKTRKNAIRTILNDDLQAIKGYPSAIRTRSLSAVEEKILSEIDGNLIQYQNQLQMILQSADRNDRDVTNKSRVKYLRDREVLLTALLQEFDNINTKLIRNAWADTKINIHNTVAIIFTFAISAIVLSMLLGYVNIKSITRPMAGLVNTLERFGSGDFSVRADLTRSDEIGYFSSRFNAMLEQLQAAHRQLSDTIEFWPDAAFVIDKKKNVIAWNRAMEVMTGIKKEDVLGKGKYSYSFAFYGIERKMLIDLVFEPDEDAERKYDRFERQVGQLVYADTYLPHMNIFASAKAGPLLDEKGNIIGAIETIRDVTEYIKARMSLQESEKKYRDIVMESIGDGYFEWDFNGNILFANEAGAKMLNSTRDEIVGMNNRQFIKKESIKAGLPIVDEVYRTGKPVRVNALDLVLKDGTKRCLELSVSLMKNTLDEPVGFRSIIRDITERLTAEKALRESQSQLSDIINFLPDACLVIDRNGKVIAWNRALEEMTGIKAEDMIGKDNYEYGIAFYGSRRKILVDLVFEPSELIEKNYILLRKDKQRIQAETIANLRGEKRFILETAAPLFNTTGEILGAIELARDITERKLAEEELKKYQEHLEVLVKQRTLELEEAKNIAEAATKAKSEFLANMSHEIRTPMNAIVGFSNLALMTGLSAKQRDYVSKIESSAMSLLGVINDILDFSKIEAGKMGLESINFRLDDVINDIITLLSAKASEKGVELITTIADDVPNALIGDPLRLGQVLVNLVNNAVKFTEKGHILLTTELLKKDAKQCRLKFSVKDTGIGMTQEQLAKIFSAFSQADATVTRKYGGTGLGLAISKYLVTMMDGDIFVDSEPDKGSTFSFTAEFTCQDKEKGKKLTTPIGLIGKKILVVDDNEMLRNVLERQLRYFKFEATAVDSGQAALEELERAEREEKPYDLVLMDLRMPQMNGLEAWRMIKNNPKIKHIPRIVMMTAFGHDDLAKQSEETGVNFLLSKPYSLSLLFDTLMEAFGQEIHGTIGSTKLATDERQELKSKINGARILLAEDNYINQQLAKEILENLGLIVDVANNGKEAVDATTTRNYDAVLMDIQMPVMGGYEAPRLIRSNPKNIHLPIIAMTAHALIGAREECLAAGMNDYISKPIDLQELSAVLAKWLKPYIQKNDHFLPIKPETTAIQANSYDLPETLKGMDVTSCLARINGNKKLLVRLLKRFSREYSDVTDKIRSALKQNDQETAQRLVHSIKGTAGNFSATDLYYAARDLEESIKDGAEFERIDRLLANKFNTALNILIDSITGIEETPKPDDDDQAEDEQKIDMKVISPLYTKLDQLLLKRSLDARELMDALQEHLPHNRFRQDMRRMSERMDNYDFVAARKILAELVKHIETFTGG